ncbi:MAG: tRNA (N6-isopentenyl adenosine(37)-C2)-methylthiotransferase MiaB [Acidimicrobiia bacterium]|nr:tRNA (N6-isopentenyl adenosine(37)-C2)-methylthiotransferase MiaB [Acidimicrobiia bacterium]
MALLKSDPCRRHTLATRRSNQTHIVEPKKFFIETFGCQMNLHDSEKVAGTLTQMGYVPTDDPSEADLVLLNTCNIREKANQKVFSRLGSLQKSYGTKPGAKVGLLGCMAQMEGVKIFERAPNVDLVVGSSSYSFIPELVEKLEQGSRHVIDVTQDSDRLFETYADSRGNPYKAFVTIMEGCNRFCSFCVVPYTRGRERSRPGDRVLSEIRRLASEGYPEVMLLGQTVNSWRDPAGIIPSFAGLLRQTAAVPGIRRVRFTSPHPSDFHPEIVEVMETTPQVCNQVHLPVQSGSTEVLRRMKRDYTREEYLRRVEFIQSSPCDIALSTDVIVGFPGETQEDFEETLSLLQRVGYDQIFSFKYSARPGTEAFALGDTVPEEEKGRRLAVLQEFQRKIQTQRNEQLVGRELEILVDGKSQKNASELMGRTTQNKIVNFPGSPELLGKFVRVRVSRAFPNSLAGELI